MFGRIWTTRIRVSEYPSARPASTNSRSLTAIVGARAMRANGGIEVNAMAMMMFTIEGPSIATRIRPRISDGNASRTSIACIVTVSRRPPCHPASMPIAVPMTIAASVETTPMISEMRAP